MGIRKPRVSVDEARRLANMRSGNVEQSVAKEEKPSQRLKALKKEKPPKPKIIKKKRLPRKQFFSEPEKIMRPEKLQVFLSADFPEQGVSPSFDNLCEQYSKTKALQMVLRKAMKDYEQKIEDGSFKNAPFSYQLMKNPEHNRGIQTSRNIPINLVKDARAHFDPLGFESARSFGKKLATSALATFFMSE